jgi:drug/metabolite transporter (DMT)-like permease
MLYLILAILASLSLAISFKLFDRFNIDTFQAIVINYWVCVLTGSLMLGEYPLHTGMLQEAWFPIALVLGFLFIVGFNVVGITVQRFGVAIASVMQRMSIAMSVPFAILYFDEAATLPKLLGTFIALGSVVLINIPNKKDKAQTATPSIKNTGVQIEKNSGMPSWLFLFPLGCFVISGFIESGLQIIEKVHFPNNATGNAIFSIMLFGLAGLMGTVWLIQLLVRGKTKLSLRNLIGGIVLGIPNYFSIYFLLLSFSDIGDASIVLPLNNIIIVVSSALIGYFLFKEQFSKTNWIGVLLALVSIYLIML